MNPFLYQISTQRWEWFVTLTFKSRDEFGNLVKVPKATDRKKMLFAFLRRAAEGNKRDKQTTKRLDCIHWYRYLWVSREEQGEANGRYHFHCLLAGYPPSRINHVERFSIKAIWSEVGGGHADVRAFDAKLRGAAYVLKGLEDYSRKNANAYEIGKYNEDTTTDLIVSNSALRKWAMRTVIRSQKTLGTYPESSALSLSGGRKAATNQRTKETLQELENRIRQNWLNHHPAGVSFVR